MARAELGLSARHVWSRVGKGEKPHAYRNDRKEMERIEPKIYEFTFRQ